MAAPGTWHQIAHSLLAFDRLRLEPLAALRCTIGVALPLAVAVVAGHPAVAVFIAVGAVSVGFGSFQGAYRSRATIMLLASLAMAISVSVGSVTAASAAAAIVVAACWSFAAGLLVALGPAGAFIGLQSAIAVLIADAYPADLRGALLRSVMVLIGGVIQTLFVVSIWPLRRFGQERRATGMLYRELATYARDLARPGVGPPAASPGLDTPLLASDPHPFARPGETLVFQALADEAERVRASLAALSLAGHRSAAVAADAALILDALADAIEHGHVPDEDEPHPSTHNGHSGGGDSDFRGTVDRTWDRLQSAATAQPIVGLLLTQLRAAWHTAEVPVGRQAAVGHTAKRAARPLRPMRAVSAITDGITTLRANLTLQSTAFRHAVRLAGGVGVATALYRLAEVPRGYWLPMTTLLVLRPEFRETFFTGSARIAGTLAGGLAASVLVLTLGTHHGVLSLLLLIFIWLGYTVFRASYTLFTICFTAYVVLLLTLSGAAGQQAALYRIANTAVGGLMALLIYAAWPTWESGRARESLATLLSALADDARLLLGMIADPSTWDPQALRRSRDAARLARSNAEASVERMLSEPEAARRIDPQLAVALLAAARRYALGALALHAAPPPPAERARPAVAVLRDHLATSLDQLAAALRVGAVTNDIVNARTLNIAPDDADGASGGETEMMVDAVNSMIALLRHA